MAEGPCLPEDLVSHRAVRALPSMLPPTTTPDRGAANLNGWTGPHASVRSPGPDSLPGTDGNTLTVKTEPDREGVHLWTC
jgi:hypothetical protein